MAAVALMATSLGARAARAEECASSAPADHERLQTANWKAPSQGDPPAWHGTGSRMLFGPAYPRSGFVVTPIVPAFEVPVTKVGKERLVGFGIHYEVGYSSSLLAAVARYRRLSLTPLREGANDLGWVNAIDVGLGFQRTVIGVRHIVKLEPYATAQRWSMHSQWLRGGGLSLSWTVNVASAEDMARGSYDIPSGRVGFRGGVRADMVDGWSTRLERPQVTVGAFLAVDTVFGL